MGSQPPLIKSSEIFSNEFMFLSKDIRANMLIRIGFLASILGVAAAFAPSLGGTSKLPLCPKLYARGSTFKSEISMSLSRREAISAAFAFAFSVIPAAKPSAANAEYKLPPLPYPYNALEPYIDEATMKFHHDKHHQAYVTNVNKALEGKPEISLVELQKDAIKAGAAVRNNGGGHYNHALFWKNMAPASQSGSPSPALAKAIEVSFGSMDKLYEAFAASAATRFGSGWAWLGVGPDGKLVVDSTPNQDNPLMEGVGCKPMIPILGLDVWEHAYYLKYQNRRPDYIKAFMSVINWAAVSDNYEKFAVKGVPVPI